MIGRARSRSVLFVLAGGLLSAELGALAPQVLVSSGAMPAHIAGRFREARGFHQSGSGQYFVFDRRGHTVYGTDAEQTSVWEIAQLGAEEGRIIDPTAFSVAADGTFAVADAPGGRDRIQVFTPVGFRINGFTLPSNGRPRITFRDVVLGGIVSMQYTGSAILLSKPENGALVTEYSLAGQPVRTFGRLRATGQESNPDVHLALNSGMPLVDPGGGFWFVFQAGVPMFQRYDAGGQLLFERHVEGREIEDAIRSLPNSWIPRTKDGEMPLVTPTIRTAAVDSRGALWLSLMAPFTYVYDGDGDKLRVVQFRGAGLVSPSSLSFGPKGTLLVTPGLLEFGTDSVAPSTTPQIDRSGRGTAKDEDAGVTGIAR